MKRPKGIKSEFLEGIDRDIAKYRRRTNSDDEKAFIKVIKKVIRDNDRLK